MFDDDEGGEVTGMGEFRHNVEQEAGSLWSRLVGRADDFHGNLKGVAIQGAGIGHYLTGAGSMQTASLWLVL